MLHIDLSGELQDSDHMKQSLQKMIDIEGTCKKGTRGTPGEDLAAPEIFKYFGEDPKQQHRYVVSKKR